MPDTIMTARSRVGVAARLGTPDDLAEARRDLRAAKLERAAREAVAATPPLTAEQVHRVGAILQGAAR